MKKLLAWLLVLLLMLSVAACGNSDEDVLEFTRAPTEPEEEEKTVEDAPALVTVTELKLPYLGVELVPGQAFDPAALPEASSMFTVPSCALEGTDNVYSYDNLEVTAFNDGTGEFVYSLYLLDETVSTAEGLKVTDTQERVVELYGEDYQDNGGEYIFTIGNVNLSILFQDGKVSAIEYVLASY